MTDTVFTPPADFDAVDYMLSSFEAIADEWNAAVLLDTSLEAARQGIPRALATLVQEDGHVCLRASIRGLDDMARTLIRLGCPFTVLHPPELRETLRQIAVDITQFAADDSIEGS